MLDFEASGGVAHVVLNRPSALNAIDPEGRAQLREAWQRIDDDDSIRVGILTGTGDRAFCAGVDLKKPLPASVNPASEEIPLTGQYLLRGFPRSKPMICAINGLALGGGLELALACDIRIAASHAEFGLTEVRIGSIPGAGGTQLLPRTVGRSAAMYMGLTGDRVDVDWALRTGLISEAVPAEELMARAQQIASRIAANAPLSAQAVKRLMSEAPDLPLEAGLRSERLMFGLLRDSDDRAEGRKAFAERRPPEFHGR